jgi:D-arabinose 5-phosphate isomerase GutQ
MSGDKILRRAKEVLRIEAEAVENVAENLDDSFKEAVNLIYSCRGKVVVTGMGKGGIVGTKIARTLASTGTPAVTLHPGDAIHGDVGIVTKDDVVLAISNSGETEEVLRLIPVIRKIGARVISMTGRGKSSLSKMSDVVLNVGVKREACPMGMVPTASTTATLALGDALAMVLLDKRGFRKGDYALYHPGGELGRKLLGKQVSNKKNKAQRHRAASLCSMLFLLCFLAASCSREKELVTVPPAVATTHAGSGERMEGGFLYTITEGGKVVLEVEGSSAGGLASDTVHLEKPRVVWHSANGLVIIGADSGVIDKKTDDIRFTGTVVVTSENWGTMECDRLDWSRDRESIKAQGSAKGKFYINQD